MTVILRWLRAHLPYVWVSRRKAIPLPWRQRPSQAQPQRIEQAAVALGARRIAAERLAHLRRAGRADRALGAVEVQAGSVERQAAEGEQGADLGLGIGQQRLVGLPRSEERRVGKECRSR